MLTEGAPAAGGSGPVPWLAVLASVAVAVGGVFWAHSIDPRGATVLDRAAFLDTESERIPPEVDGWTEIDLPADASTSTKGRSGWFRLEVPTGELPQGVLGLYLPLVRTSAAIHWNGTEIARVGDFSGRTVRNWQIPVLVPIPRDLAHRDGSLLSLRIAGLTGTASLGRVWIGPHRVLREAFLFRRALKLTILRVLAGALAFTALLMIGIWTNRPHESIYGLFGLLLGSYAGYLALFGLVEIPVPERWWTWARVVVLGWFSASIAIVTPRFFAVERPRIERLLVALMTTMTVATALLAAFFPRVFDVVGARIFPTMSLTIGLYPAAVGFLALRNRRDLPALALLASGFTLLVFGLHDVAMVNGLVSANDGYLVHYGAPLVAGSFAWMLLLRFVDALSEAERLNRELESRVARKSAELAHIERDRALAAERERLMSDIHDGVGSQLASSLVLLESGRGDSKDLHRALRTALDDLRLVVDSLEPAEGGPAEILGMVRHRLGRRIEKSGVDLGWSISDLPPVPDFGPEKALHLARIVQEGISNAVEHARARRITVTARVDSDEDGRFVRIEIADDGIGIAPGATRGRGLASMERRARAFGRPLEVDTSGSGTTIRLGIPLRDSDPPSPYRSRSTSPRDNAS